MNITVTFTAASVSELHQQMREMLGYTKPEHLPQQVTQTVVSPELSQPQVAEVLEQASTPAPEKKTRTRKPKEAKPVEQNTAVAEQPFETKQHDAKAEEPAAPVAAGALVEDNTPTKEKVHQALQQVNVAVNLNKAREILSKFKVNRISEVQPSQYQAFIDECNTAVAMS